MLRNRDTQLTRLYKWLKTLPKYLCCNFIFNNVSKQIYMYACITIVTLTAVEESACGIDLFIFSVNTVETLGNVLAYVVT